MAEVVCGKADKIKCSIDNINYSAHGCCNAAIRNALEFYHVPTHGGLPATFG